MKMKKSLQRKELQNMRHASKYFTELTAIFFLFFMISCTKQNQEGNAIESSSKLSSESIENSAVDSKKINPENSSADSKEKSKDSDMAGKESSSVETTKPPLESLSENQVQAIQTAKDYLDTMPLSQTELLQMLTVENINLEDAKFALSHVNVNWIEQAEIVAKEYMEDGVSSKDDLIDVLMNEGFTKKEAEKATLKVGLK